VTIATEVRSPDRQPDSASFTVCLPAAAGSGSGDESLASEESRDTLDPGFLASGAGTLREDSNSSSGVLSCADLTGREAEETDVPDPPCSAEVKAGGPAQKSGVALSTLTVAVVPLDVPGSPCRLEVMAGGPERKCGVALSTLIVAVVPVEGANEANDTDEVSDTQERFGCSTLLSAPDVAVSAFTVGVQTASASKALDVVDGFDTRQRLECSSAPLSGADMAVSSSIAEALSTATESETLDATERSDTRARLVDSMPLSGTELLSSACNPTSTAATEPARSTASIHDSLTSCTSASCAAFIFDFSGRVPTTRCER